MKRLSFALALLPLPAFAHPGDHGFAGLFHLMTEPDHLAMLALGVAAAIYGLIKFGARR